ncbi:hypothetical protein ACE1MK_15485 [Tenacibaculum maritimum]|nr:hypothetical protein [Tenacibaculum maritimum]MCD9581798.1 hypothetical protein [Tenacibaculum maritimum]MCD9635972.1 hypothetical protein [Tenacibaculum maritimum]
MKKIKYKISYSLLSMFLAWLFGLCYISIVLFSFTDISGGDRDNPNMDEE